MRIVKCALDACGLPGERLLRVGVRKGIYLGAANQHAIEIIRSMRFSEIERPTIEDLRTYWLGLLERRRESSNHTRGDHVTSIHGCK